MTDCIKNYERALKKELRCGKAARKRLLERFHTAQRPFLEENASPDIQALHDAFGPPAEMAKTLMADTTQKERQAYIRNKRVCRGIAIGCAALLLVFTFIVFFIKENRPVYYYNNIEDLGTTPVTTAGE